MKHESVAQDFRTIKGLRIKEYFNLSDWLDFTKPSLISEFIGVFYFMRVNRLEQRIGLNATLWHQAHFIFSLF